MTVQCSYPWLPDFFFNNRKCLSAKEEILILSVAFVQICKTLSHFYGSHLIPTLASPLSPCSLSNLILRLNQYCRAVVTQIKIFYSNENLNWWLSLALSLILSEIDSDFQVTPPTKGKFRSLVLCMLLLCTRNF